MTTTMMMMANEEPEGDNEKVEEEGNENEAHKSETK